MMANENFHDDGEWVTVGTGTTNDVSGSIVEIALSLDGPPVCPNMTDADFRRSILLIRDDTVALIERRLDELKAWNITAQDRVMEWFGRGDSATKHRLVSGLLSTKTVLVGLTPLNFVRSSPDTDRAVGCTPNTKNLSGEVAHVCAPDTATHTISISTGFCTLPDKSFGKLDSKQLTLIHEVSHFYDTFSSKDHRYGQFLSRQLAKADPERAIENADNIAWYVACRD
jgi:hypothetical protein